MEQAIPIQVNHLFGPLDDKLIELLQSLSEEEWQKQTIARLWKVKDVAAHLLDGNMRCISARRDKYFTKPTAAIESYDGLVNYLNELNADWVKAMKRVSPAIILKTLEATGKEYTRLITSLPPFERSMYSVAWAGETESWNWFHVAREYTEKWLHQQQIRDAVGKQGIISKEFFYPFINTFMQGLPHTYRNTEAKEGSSIQVTVTTEAGGNWFLLKKEKGWGLSKEIQQAPSALVTIDPDTAWKLFSKSLGPSEAEPKISITGDTKLGEAVLTMVSVMA